LERIADISQDVIGVRPRVIRDHRAMSALADLFPALRTVSGPVPTANDWLVPLFSPDELIAVLKLKSATQKTTFDSDDWEFLISISEHFSMIASQMRARNEKAESEYALEIQRGLLPRSIPQVPGFTIAGAWQPAKDVGGDYYDAFPLNENEIALVVADVSGKGAPAALLMANLQATAKAYATLTSSPGELCRRVNSAICGNITPGRFITFFYAVLNTKLSLLTYCNAGHNPPLVVSQDGSCRKLAVGGTVLGLFAQAEFQEDSVQLRTGDRLVIFTDGVIEAADSHEREFGDDRLFTAITASANVSADELRDSIMQAVTHFCRGDFSDDATLLVLLVNAPGNIN
jgi:sigma-B regulation protein RsbU (phosphoserine phosphatase)